MLDISYYQIYNNFMEAKIKCEFIWCIHNKNNGCVLDTVEIDCFGHCAECILQDISDAELWKYIKENSAK